MYASGKVTVGSLPDCWASLAACINSSTSLRLSPSIPVLTSESEFLLLGYSEPSLRPDYSTIQVGKGSLLSDKA